MFKKSLPILYSKLQNQKGSTLLGHTALKVYICIYIRHMESPESVIRCFQDRYLAVILGERSKQGEEEIINKKEAKTE